MTTAEKAVQWAVGIAKDDSHGYDQANRWGADYDCSSLVISAYKAAGVPLESTYTGNMWRDFLNHGFSVPSGVDLMTGAGLIPGDVLLNEKNHTAMYIGNGQIVSATINEMGTVSGGQTGDQTGKEVSTQTFYMHSKGWVGFKAKDSALAEKLAKGMKIACDNPNIGYDQNERLGVVRKGIETTEKTECDCSSLVRAVLKYAGVEVTNFTTATEKAIIMATGLFDEVKINSAADVTNGMILVTKTKGHTAIVVSGATEKKEEKKQQEQKEEQKQNEKDEQKQDKNQMSKDNAEQLLKAAMQKEKKTQERMQKLMQQPRSRKLDKNW